MDSRQPAEAYPVGHYIEEECQARGWGVVYLLTVLNWRYPRLVELECGEEPLTGSEAVELARVFGTSPDYWANLDRTWQEVPAERRAQ